MLPLLYWMFTGAPLAPGAPPPRPLSVYCGTGDHLWAHDREPVDSPATTEAMFDWMTRSYGVTRVYWRGGQQEIWAQEYQVGRDNPQTADWTAWCNHLIRDLHLNDHAVRAAHRRGLEIYLASGLFEHGVQPDVGIICPYVFEDRLRIAHPDWCPRDRWSQRRAPGPLSFALPEVRRLLVSRYLQHVVDHGYDGLTFYTYVENVGLRYDNEFGYEPAVLAEFRKLHPGLDPTTTLLTAPQRQDLNRCRGLFVTRFLRELHAALQARGKRLSVILDAKNPAVCQPWWGHPVPGTGSVEMDWPTWVREGIVDELYVQLGEVADQQRTLDRLLAACASTPVKLTVRATHPLQDASWEAYRRRGVTPLACLTSPVNDLERYTTEAVGPQTLTSTNWGLRAQTLGEVAAGRLSLPASRVALATRDPHVLVRRRALQALAALQAVTEAPAIERCLADPESSVRIAAAAALGKAPGPQSAERLLSAVAADHGFQFKEACVASLGALGEPGLRAASAGLGHPDPAVREVCVRALYNLGKAGYPQEAYGLLRPVVLRRQENEIVRYWAAYSLVGSRLRVDAATRRQIAADFLALLCDEPSVTVQLHLAYGLGYLQEFLEPVARQQALEALVALFGEYGDGSRRPDAAYGWRLVGNALHQFGAAGDAALEQLRAQREDKWLAWIAYEVLYVPQRGSKMDLVTAQEAVALHAKYAPAFPGYRAW